MQASPANSRSPRAELRIAGAAAAHQARAASCRSPEHEVRARDVARGDARRTGEARGHEQRRRARACREPEPSAARVRCGASTPVRILDRVSGTIDWSMNVNMRARGSSWVGIRKHDERAQRSTCRRRSARRPPRTMPLRVERRDDAQPARVPISSSRSYGRIAQFAAHRQRRRNGRRVDRSCAAVARTRDRTARRARAPSGRDCGYAPSCPRSIVDDWIAVLRRGGRANRLRAQSEALVRARRRRPRRRPVRCASGAASRDLKLGVRESARRAGASTSTAAKSPARRPGRRPDGVAPNGRIVARLVADRAAGSRQPAPLARRRRPRTTRKSDAPAANPWPEIDIAADALLSKERESGRLELVAQPRGAEWRIDRLAARQRRGQARSRGRMAGRRARSSRRSSTSSSTRRMPARFLARYRLRRWTSQGRRRRSTGSSRGPARRTSSTSPRSRAAFHDPSRSGPLHQARPGPGQAARRAVAAGAAAARRRSISATSSAMVSRSTRSPATCASRTA